MALCVACNKPLTLFIESAEEDEEMETMEGSASANTGSSYVDDDLQLQCGCHFHWFVHCSKWKGRNVGLTSNCKGNVSSTLTLCQNALIVEETS